MNIAIIGVGRLREHFWRDAADEYKKRLSRFVKLEEIELGDKPEAAKPSPADAARVMAEEGREILRRIRPEDEVIALCIEGKPQSSEAFAETLRGLAGGGRRVVFIIGGSLGLAPEVTARAQRRLSFSPMTFPHQLARVMLLEQLYRACKINAGERYHK